MSGHYSPVDSDGDMDMDEAPARRFRLSRDGLARQMSPVSPIRATDDDNLNRALMEYHRSLPSLPLQSATPVGTRPPVNVASPTPRRHDSVSSSSIASEEPASTQETFVNDITHQRSQSTPQPAPWNPPHQPQQRHSLLPVLPASSPLFQQHTAQSFNSFARPFSSASAPRIIPVSHWDTGDQSRPGSALSPISQASGSRFNGSGFAPQSAYGRPNSLYRPGSTQEAILFASADPYHHHIPRSGSPPSDDETLEGGHNRYSSTGSEAFHKPVGGFDPNKYLDPEAEKQQAQEADTLHFGPAPAGRQIRRGRTKKKIPLTQGHLVLDLPVPSRLVLSWKGIPEMMKTRYTAVTCDPDEFMDQHFSLRQVEYGRSTELFIIITMYNEDEVLFCRTLYGVMKNIAHLSSRKSSRVWGDDSWRKVVVCIVADGRRNVNPRVLDCLTALGVYQDEYMVNKVNNTPVQAHMFEYTCGFGIDPALHFKYPDKGIVPTQIIFLMKEHNQKKINSHRWALNAFGPVLQPNVCVLLDVGTRPGANSLYHLWKSFDVNSNVGGACGEIAVYKGPWWTYLLNPLVAAQNFEYKMSNILDKPTESMFGYIGVLPGAFSAYRYIALQNDKTTGKGPLASYFKGEVLHGRETDIFTSNMYLAEDRILSFELVAKANSNWILKYVKGSVGETDVPDTLDELIMQRRRWLNGSLFAAVYSLAHIMQILRSGHSIQRKLWLFFESVYTLINLVFAWFAIGNYCLFFVILTTSIEDPKFKLPPETMKFVNLATHYTLAIVIMACFLFSMGNRPKASPWKYNTTVGILALLTGYMVACGIICILAAIGQVHNSYLDRNMIFSILITYGTWVISSALALDPWHLLTSAGQYTLLLPLYLVVLNIYAFANLDDITWGTKGADLAPLTDLGNVVQDSESRIYLEIAPDAPNDIYSAALDNLKTKKPLPRPPGATEAEKDQMKRDYYANLRTNLLLAWALSNSFLVICILTGVNAKDTFSTTKVSKTRVYMTFVLAFVAIQNIIKFFGSTFFMCMVAITG